MIENAHLEVWIGHDPMIFHWSWLWQWRICTIHWDNQCSLSINCEMLIFEFIDFLHWSLLWIRQSQLRANLRILFFNVCVPGIEHNALFFKWPFVNCSTANLSYLSKIIMSWPSYCLKENEAINVTLCRIIYVATHFSNPQ